MTIKDVAIRAGVSLGTASKVLNGDKSVKESNRKAVEEAVQFLNYNVNMLARSLAHKPIKLGILLPFAFENVYRELLSGINDAIEALSDYKVTAFFRSYRDYNDSEAFCAALDEFEQEDVQGLVVGPSYVGSHTKRIEELRDKGIVVIAVVSDVKHVGCLAGIRVDAIASGQIAADLSRLLLRDDESVAVIVGDMDMEEHSNKAQSFSRRAKETGVPLVGVYEDHSKVENAYRLTESLLKSEPDLRLIYVATANSVSVCKCIYDYGKAHQVRVIATDVLAELKPFILDGTVIAILNQHLKRHGKAAVNVLYSYLREGMLKKEETRIRPDLLLQNGMLEKLESESEN